MIIPTADTFYQSRKQANRDALAENNVVVLDVIKKYVDSKPPTDNTIGGYSSFCFIEEQANAQQVMTNIQHTLDDLLQHAAETYRPDPRELHFHTHIHAFPALPSNGGTIYDEAKVRRFLEISEELISQTPSFEVQFKGIACTKDAVLLCGYATPPLDELRTRYYHAMERYPDAFILPPGQTIESIKEKYGLGTAAVTATRLLAKLQNPSEYVATAQKHSETDLGTITITHLTFTAQNGWIDVHNKNNDRENYSEHRIMLKS